VPDRSQNDVVFLPDNNHRRLREVVLYGGTAALSAAVEDAISG
jgi:hypothetical protein